MEPLAIAVGIFVGYVLIRAALKAARIWKEAETISTPRAPDAGYSGPRYTVHGREIG